MKKDKEDKLRGEVHVDETIVGGYSSADPGRSLLTKSAVFVAVKILDDGRTGNIDIFSCAAADVYTIKASIRIPIWFLKFFLRLDVF